MTTMGHTRGSTVVTMGNDPLITDDDGTNSFAMAG